LTKLAIQGGTPVRTSLLPYGRHCLDNEDIEAVVKVLNSDWLTTGPKILEFEQAFTQFSGTERAVAVSSGTAALHSAMHALNVGEGDEVIVPPITFAASANCAIYVGAKPVFADVDPETLLLDPDHVQTCITPRTKAIIAVDYAGQPCDYDALREVSKLHGLALVGDACHALGGGYKGRKVGSLADLNIFSFHPVKHITTGEGGMISTNYAKLARKMEVFRSHGITADFRQREAEGSWFYEMADLGYNYRITDIQCALGLTQLSKLSDWIVRRQEIAKRYDEAFGEVPAVTPLGKRPDVSHAYHLYVIKLDLSLLNVDRAAVFSALRAEGIGVNVHYIPVHLHPYYQNKYSTKPGLCPAAEEAYERIISLPIFPLMNDSDVNDVITSVNKVVDAYKV